jgi:acid phosphatase class B
MCGGQTTIKIRCSAIAFRLEGKGQGKITQTQSMLEEAIHSTKYLQNIEFSDRKSTKDNKVNYIKRKANSMEAS